MESSGSRQLQGHLVDPLSESPGFGLTGLPEGGPLSGGQPIAAQSVFESFTEGASCGVAPRAKKQAKTVKSGTFATTAVEVG